VTVKEPRLNLPTFFYRIFHKHKGNERESWVTGIMAAFPDAKR
jgi:hypothetical protein